MKFLQLTLNVILFLRSLKSTHHSYEVKYLPILTISILFLILIGYAEGHKLLEISSNENIKFESSLVIPNHTISWAIYQTLESNISNARFYKFENYRINDSLYVQLSIPMIEKYKEFSPSLIILEPLLNKDKNSTSIIDKNLNYINNINLPFEIPNNYFVAPKSWYEYFYTTSRKNMLSLSQGIENIVKIKPPFNRLILIALFQRISSFNEVAEQYSNICPLTKKTYLIGYDGLGQGLNLPNVETIDFTDSGLEKNWIVISISNDEGCGLIAEEFKPSRYRGFFTTNMNLTNRCIQLLENN